MVVASLDVDVRLGVGGVPLQVSVVVPPLVSTLVDILHQIDSRCHILGIVEVIDR